MNRTVVVVVGLAIFLVGGVIAGCVALAEPGALEYGYDDDEAIVSEWCDNVDQVLRKGHPFSSFAEVVAAAEDGALVEPTEPPPSTEEELPAWQDEHAAFLDASYLAALEGVPGEVGLADRLFETSLGEAGAGQAIAAPKDLRYAAGQLDRYRADHC